MASPMTDDLILADLIATKRQIVEELRLKLKDESEQLSHLLGGRKRKHVRPESLGSLLSRGIEAASKLGEYCGAAVFAQLSCTCQEIR